MPPVRRLGYRPDLPDARDRHFSAHRAAGSPIPEAAMVDAIIGIKNQGDTSSCVGQAESQAIRLAYLAQGRECPELSALSIYRPARNFDGTEGDEGTFLRSGMQAISSFGVATEAAWPMDEGRVNDQLPFSVLHSAYDRHGQRSYYRIISGATDDFCRAIAAKCPVVAGWSVSEHFVSADGKEVFGPQAGLPSAGGHAMCVVGYGPSGYFESQLPGFVSPQPYDRIFEIMGSWGTDYGYSGRILVTPEFIAEASDAWAVNVTPGVSA